MLFWQVAERGVAPIGPDPADMKPKERRRAEFAFGPPPETFNPDIDEEVRQLIREREPLK